MTQDRDKKKIRLKSNKLNKNKQLPERSNRATKSKFALIQAGTRWRLRGEEPSEKAGVDRGVSAS